MQKIKRNLIYKALNKVMAIDMMRTTIYYNGETLQDQIKDYNTLNAVAEQCLTTKV